MPISRILARPLQATPLGLLLGLGLLGLPASYLAANETAAPAVEATPAPPDALHREGPQPITILDRQSILDSGAANIAELLRSMPANSQGMPQPFSDEPARSIAATDLRGLGPSRTLVLVDGRRMPTTPEGTPANNLNQIPLSRVERIEVLPAGSSAVYGSDAIGGVVQIITRSAFSGMEATVARSFPEMEGGDHQQGAILMGHESTRGRMMTGAEYDRRDPIMERDREDTPGSSFFANNLYRDADLSQPLSHPEYGASVPDAGCTGENFSTINEGPDRLCLYDFRAEQSGEAKTENHSIFVRGEYHLTDAWDLELDAGVDRLQSRGQSAPAPSSPWLEDGAPILNPGSPNHPATPPGAGGLNPEYDDPYYQQFDDQELHVAHRFAPVGKRETATDAHVHDLSVRAAGDLENWTLEFGVRHNDYRSNTFSDNLLIGDLAQDRLDRGSYNLYDPETAVQQDVDTFGQENLDSFRHRATRDSRFLQQEADLIAWTDPAELPAGPVSMVAGVQYRQEDFHDQHDPLTQGGRVVGRGGIASGTDREAGAAFLESELPLTRDLDLRLATRYDRYSDFGDRFSPKLAARYQPTDALLLRASWSEGFRAPDLASLSREASPGTLRVTDPATAGEENPEQPSSVSGTFVSQPDLSAETSEHIGLGGVFQIRENFQASLDYYRVRIRDRISTVTLQTIRDCLEEEASPCPDGLTEWDSQEAAQLPDPSRGLGLVRDEATGAITFAQTGAANFGETRTAGVDMALSLDYEIGGLGHIEHRALWTWVEHFRLDGEEQAGSEGYPEHRGQLSHTLQSGDYRFSLLSQYIEAQDGPELPTGPDSVGSWMRHDIQAQWQTPWDGKVSIGIRNVLNESPPEGGFAAGFNQQLYDRFGREPWLRYTQSF